MRQIPSNICLPIATHHYFTSPLPSPSAASSSAGHFCFHPPLQHTATFLYLLCCFHYYRPDLNNAQPASTPLPPMPDFHPSAPPCHRCLSPQSQPQSNPSLQPPPSSPTTTAATDRQPPPSLPQQPPSPLPLFPATAVCPQPQPTAGHTYQPLLPPATGRCLLFPVASSPQPRSPLPFLPSPLCRSRLWRTCSCRQPALFSSLAATATHCCSRPSSPLPSSSIAVGPLPLKHQQRHHYLVVPHLLGAPHDAAASSLAATALAAVAASNRAPCRCTSLLPSLPLLAAPCSSPGCRSNRCPSLPTPPLATTAAPIISN
ncbi:hypothetical protein B296_00012393 [Ensete ventricosum]|uniref:Uncharacterized protein n=1 Tax=Ensete ventricosum TaxID=4639 RepID=A0A426YLE4_ENSVE|nr:hypothetical protein B296_00012393 [Ensete ventricosum]